MKILIVGAIKSGTSALAYRVQEQVEMRQSKPYQLVFEPYKLAGLELDDDTIVKYVRPHDLNDLLKHNSEYDQRLLIVRHPYAVLVSLLLFCGNNQAAFGNDEVVAEYLEILRRKETNPDQVNLAELVDFLLEKAAYDIVAEVAQYYRALEVLVASGRFAVLRYEDVERGIDLHLGGCPVQLSFDVDLGDEHRFISRERSAEAWRNYLTDHDYPVLAEAFGDALLTHAYDAVPIPGFRRAIDEKVCSGYFVATLNKRRSAVGFHSFAEGQRHYGLEGQRIMAALQLFRTDRTLALKHLQLLIEQNPMLPEPLLASARLHRLAAKGAEHRAVLLEQARNDVEGALALNASFVKAKEELVRILYAEEKYARALEAAKRIREPPSEIRKLADKSRVLTKRWKSFRGLLGALRRKGASLATRIARGACHRT